MRPNVSPQPATALPCGPVAGIQSSRVSPVISLKEFPSMEEEVSWAAKRVSPCKTPINTLVLRLLLVDSFTHLCRATSIHTINTLPILILEF